MTKEQLQDIAYKLLGDSDAQVQVTEVSDGVAKMVVMGHCGGMCACSDGAFETIKTGILSQHKEIKEVERVV